MSIWKPGLLEFKKSPSLSEIPEELKEEWFLYVKMDNKIASLIKRPLVKNHKVYIMQLIGYWPVSVTCWVFYDMLRDIVKSIYNRIAGWLQSMADKVFAVRIYRQNDYIV